MVLEILMTFVFVLAIFQIISLLPSKSKELRENKLEQGMNYNKIPTLLIPGWAGNKWTYNSMITEYQAENIAQKTMTIYVSPRGKIKIYGDVKDKKNALIQVLFDWNYTTNYQPQTKWITKIMEILHDNYGLNEMNVIAHSWGGSAWLHALANSKKLQKVIKFPSVILLGVPVEESFNNTNYQIASEKRSTDKNYHKLVAQTKYLSLQAKINFYNFLGEIRNQNTDGAVPHVQSEFLQKIITPSWAHYNQKTFNNTTHSGLHSNKKVLSEIKKILWKD